jgi:hypothetical protein
MAITNSPRLTRVDVDILLTSLKQAVVSFNKTEQPIVITDLILFGSALYENRDSFGDVDIDFDISFKSNQRHKWSEMEYWASYVSKFFQSLDTQVNVHWGAVAHLDCAHKVIMRYNVMEKCYKDPDTELTPNGEFWLPYLKNGR